MNHFRHLLVTGVTITMLGAGAQAALAETMTLRAELSGQNEVPPNDAVATGGAEAAFDTDTGTLTWQVVFVGLSGPVTGAHIHGPSEPSANAGIVIAFENPGQSPITGTATLTAEQTEALLAGQYYVNIHTEMHPGGELRGHLTVAE